MLKNALEFLPLNLADIGMHKSAGTKKLCALLKNMVGLSDVETMTLLLFIDCYELGKVKRDGGLFFNIPEECAEASEELAKMGQKEGLRFVLSLYGMTFDKVSFDIHPYHYKRLKSSFVPTKITIENITETELDLIQPSWTYKKQFRTTHTYCRISLVKEARRV